MLTMSLRPSASCRWSVCLRGVELFSDLPLGQAIKLARAVARAEHQRSGCPIRVEMPGTHGQMVLAHYPQQGDRRANQTLVAA